MWTVLQPQASVISSRSRCLIDQLLQNQRGCILVTTRDRAVGAVVAGLNVIQLTVLSEDEATQMLDQSLIKHNVNSQRSTAVQLVNELACIPLALL